MSRQSKNTRLRAVAKAFSEARKKGEKGPSKTERKHGKRWTYRSNPDTQKRIAEALKASNTLPARTSGKEILEGAGSAAL